MNIFTRLAPKLVFLTFLSLAVSCATMNRAPRGFLDSSDHSMDQWLDTPLPSVDVAEVRIMHLPLTDAFMGMKIAIGRADAPVEGLRVTLHTGETTRRQALWLLAQKYDLRMTVEQVPGQPSYISLSQD